MEKILPEDVPITDIEARLGDAWVPADVTHAIVAKLMGTSTDRLELNYSPSDGKWLLSQGPSFRETPEMKAMTAGIGKDALSIMKTALNNGDTSVWITESDGKKIYS